MRLFILIPTVKDEDRWSNSEYLGEVIVRAHSPEEARQLAARQYTRLPRRHKKPQHSPWTDSEEVLCEPYVGLDYSSRGNVEILYPRDFRI